LILAAPSHHRPSPPTLESTTRPNHCSPVTSNDFCNKIDPEQTSLSFRQSGQAHGFKAIFLGFLVLERNGTFADALDRKTHSLSAANASEYCPSV
jgi:hypothetical protein